MAEIRVEPKKKTPIWPWIIGILILLGLIWLLVEAFSDDNEYEDIREEQLEEAEVEDEVGSLNADDEQTLVLNIYQTQKEAEEKLMGAA